MIKKLFYLDTCIWLNLLKKEGDASKGVPYFKIAEKFIKGVEKDNNILFVSYFILKELKYKLGSLFKVVRDFIYKEDFIIIIKALKEDYNLARKIESKHEYKIAFYDCLHIAISKRVQATLVTRDKELIKIAKRYIMVKKPEKLIK